MPVNLFRGIEVTKVSVYVDDSVWLNFKRHVFNKYGNLRKLSSEVESILREVSAEDTVVSAFEKVGVKANGTVSSNEVKALRPSLRGLPSEEILRQVRRKRVVEALP